MNSSSPTNYPTWEDLFPEGLPTAWLEPRGARNLCDLRKYSPVRVLAELQADEAPVVFVPLADCSDPKAFNKTSKAGAAPGQPYSFVRVQYGEHGQLAIDNGWRQVESKISWAGNTWAVHSWFRGQERWRAGKIKLSGNQLVNQDESLTELIGSTKNLVMLPVATAAVLASGLCSSRKDQWSWEDHEECPESHVTLRVSGFKNWGKVEAQVSQAEKMLEDAASMSQYHTDNQHGLSWVHTQLACVALSKRGRKTEDPSQFKTGTLELPPFLGDLEDQLWGPSNGDENVSRDSVLGTRPGYPFESHFVLAHTRPARTMVYVGLPGTRLWTAYGSRSGVIAPRELNDPHLTEVERSESEAFWAEHAFAYRNGEHEARLLAEMTSAGCTWVYKKQILVHLFEGGNEWDNPDRMNREQLQERWARISDWDPKHKMDYSIKK
jgi:hypothetical protein